MTSRERNRAILTGVLLAPVLYILLVAAMLLGGMAGGAVGATMARWLG